MKFSFSAFIKGQRSRRAPVTTADLSGKTILVVGANAGLGFEATKHFATMKPGRLILACRSETRGQEALEKLRAEINCTTAELWILDLADFGSVQSFADKFEREGGRLDIILANAATILPKYQPTRQGWETCLQVNCLSMPLLALLLLPHMVKTAEQYGTVPRIVVVASEVHHWASIERRVVEGPNILGTLGSKEYCTSKAMGTRYFLTKLLNIMFVRAMNKHLSTTAPIVVNAVNPGYCYSNIRTTFSGFQALIDSLMERAIALPTEIGSRQLVWAALGMENKPLGLKGEYISLEKVEEVSDYILSPEGATVQERIWTELVQILTKAERVSEVVNVHL
ncbi:hypothetical protein MIND_00861400 [Mycena indigotica]|uniref:NAD(P)-binding protein n=1 Tax=Mycena indigotica TaxID=2126181 RepID=A0A8H6VYS6_9AGAR|nr:uncharacterized protein MIND_00861400 [Mycena indigotica]KAF7299129.1 hypothetical protein MIND_00861400 [Mycena indigotica]